MLFTILLLFYFLISVIFKGFDHDFSAFASLFWLMKWITDYDKCTFSYVECKLRKVKREEGYINYIMEEVRSVNKLKWRYIIYIYVLVVFIINMMYKLNYL